MIAQDYIPYPSERQYMGYRRAHHADLFPRLLDRQLVGDTPQALLLDTKLIPVVGMKRSKKRSAFAESAAYGYCAARQLHYFGYKLVVLTTLEGILLIYDLVAANLDERQAAEAVLWRVQRRVILGDKGFIGVEWQAHIRDTTQNSIFTPKRHNQLAQNPPTFDPLLGILHERIETTFHQLQNTGRHIEHLLARTDSPCSEGHRFSPAPAFAP